ncbi:helix-turn-helix domain-containing protein [Actinomadura mexicana]|uniref:Homeodomain-like domain-containing protein n=1 Tax=Actinomadura mexicana TaxID=134959 RepID=A0A238WTA1_9ACTN|nr:helix-turn-helix domain-containing protein [Actinomadura mexicana]SNR49796.1 hypothetical protein SAMN06265355_103272 [Actinomadura mexicana]
MSGPMPDEIRDKLKPKALELRRQGWTYREIAGSLNISISTCSLWLRHLPEPPRKGYSQERVAAMWRSRWEPIHLAREQQRRETKLRACREIGAMDERDILMAGALAYWCEGEKDKIYKRREWVSFINSDPALILLFLRFLEVAGVLRGQLRIRLHIHETADIEAAAGWWSELTGYPADEFRKPAIKRHNPKSVRKNLVDEYRGCLQISATGSAELYRKIEGWAYAAMLGPAAAEERLVARSDETIREIIAKRAAPTE